MNEGNTNAAGGNVWAPAHDDLLKQMLQAGESAAQIAAALNRKFGSSYSRNAVLGRIHRQGLSVSRVRLPKKEKAPPVVRRKTPFVPKVAHFACEPSTGLRVADVIPRHVPLLELQADECRWPYGDGPFTFCGNPVFACCSYCEPHQALSVGLGTGSERAAHRVAA